jgi:N6-adenosine-specific RNA methylase IME4
MKVTAFLRSFPLVIQGLKIVDHNVRQVIFAPRGKRHSEKPQQVHEGLERLYGDVRRLELFGRRERPGWKVWGNQVEGPYRET